MDPNSSPLQWTDREWLAFLLIAAVDSDGVQDFREMRFPRLGLGVELVDAMLEFYYSLDPEIRSKILRESLPRRLPTLKSREKVLNLLKNVVFADGEYSTEEQKWVKQISAWLRQS